MKRSNLVKLLTAIAAICLMLTVFTACDLGLDKVDLSLRVKFVVNDEVYYKVTTTKGATIDLPESPRKDEWIFDGWYFDNGTFEKPFDGKVYGDGMISIMVYAKWKACEHNVVHVAAKAPTCLEVGWDAYDRCPTCYYTTYVEKAALGHIIKQGAAQEANESTLIGWDAYWYCDREGCDYTTKQERPWHEHKDEITIVKAKAATCTEYGWSAYYTCSHDGCDFTAEQLAAHKIDAKGHKGGTATCQAKAICTVCGNEYGDLADHDFDETTWVQGETSHYHACKTSGCTEVKDEASHADDDNDHNCDTCGKTVSTHAGGTATCTKKAECTTCGNEYGDLAEHTIVLDTTKGNNGYTWTSDYSSCVAHGKCDGTGCAHTEDTTATVTPTQKQALTCLNDETYDYTASFTVTWAETQTLTDIVKTSATGHNYGAISCAWNDAHTAFIATRTCPNCSKDIEGHTQTATSTYHLIYLVTTNPTCTEAGEADYMVKFDVEWIEGYQMVSGWVPPKAHVLSDYEFDMNNHWGVCTGCKTSVTEAHSFDDDCKCVCGFVKGTDDVRYSYDSTLKTYRVDRFAPADGATAVDVVIANYYDGNKGFLPVTYIRSYAFGGDSSTRDKIKSVIIPEGITKIDTSAFGRCTNLASVTLPDSLEYLGIDAFQDTAWEKSCLDTQIDGEVYIGNILYTYKGTMPEDYTLNINEGTKFIAPRAFNDQSELKVVNMPDSLTFIGYEAFRECWNLQTIQIGTNVKTIAGYAFSDCQNLQTITFNSKLETIEDDAFAYCEDIKTLTIPSSVKTIGSYAFSSMDLLESVVIEGSGLTSIEKYAFLSCPKLTSITFSVSLEKLKEISKDVWYSASPNVTVYYDGGSFKVHYDKADSTCTEDGNIEYWYNFIDGKNYSHQYFSSDTIIEDSVVIPAAGHTGGTATCQAKAICTVCGNEYGALADHDFDETTWVQGETSHYHACTTSGCTEVKDEAAHGGGTATCQAKAICTVCGNEYGDLADHDFDETTWIQGETSHYHACKTSGCTEVKDEAAHADDDNDHNCDTCGKTVSTHAGGTATCQAKAICTVCGNEYGDLADHDFDETTWVQGETSHYHACTTSGCTEVKDEAAHSFTNFVCTCGLTTIYGTYDFVNNVSAWQDWGMSYAPQNFTHNAVKFSFNYAVKQNANGTINDRPVMATNASSDKNAKDSYLEVDLGTITMTSVTFNLKQWNTVTFESIIVQYWNGTTWINCGELTTLSDESTVTGCFDSATKARLLISNPASTNKQLGITSVAISNCVHTWNEGTVTTTATCIEEGVKTFTCSECGGTKTVAIAKANHSYAASWSFNTTNHWHACKTSGCTSKSAEAAHADDDKNHACDVCGATMDDSSAPNVEITVATFTFGEKGAASHLDGQTIGSSKIYSYDTYNLALTNCQNVYDGAYDKKGNSCLKLGTSNNAGSFKFVVPNDITKVTVYIAQYKNNATKVTINGIQYTINTASDDGIYTEISIDTTTNKTVTLSVDTKRCMIDQINYCAMVDPSTGGEGSGETGSETTKKSSMNYTFEETIIKSSSVTENLGEVMWTITNNGGYYGYDDTKGQQIGSGSSPAKNITLTTSGLANYNSITLNLSGASNTDAKVEVTIGGKSAGTENLTNTATAYTFYVPADADGYDIVVTITQTTKKAVYIKSIVVS